jgi:hypothetical protein
MEETKPEGKKNVWPVVLEISLLLLFIAMLFPEAGGILKKFSKQNAYYTYTTPELAEGMILIGNGAKTADIKSFIEDKNSVIWMNSKWKYKLSAFDDFDHYSIRSLIFLILMIIYLFLRGASLGRTIRKELSVKIW